MSRITSQKKGGQGKRSAPRPSRPNRPAHRTSQGAASPLVGKLVELNIDTLALGGAGVARMPETIDDIEEFSGAGMAIFVDGALPGSRVRARLTAVHRRHAEAVVSEVLAPSPEAVTPFCPHFSICGGCSLQHLAPESQLAWKERQILDALRRIGKVEPKTVLPAVAAPLSQRFRNKMEFAFQGRSQDLRLGLYETGTSGQAGGQTGGQPEGRTGVGRVFDLSTCPIFPEAGVELVLAVRAACKEAGLTSYDRARGEGFLRHLVLRHSVHQDSFLAQLITSPATEAQGRAVQTMGETLLARFPKLTGFAHSERGRADGLSQAERTRLTLGSAVLIETLENVQYSISADAFFQTCTLGAQALYAALRTLADLAPSDTVFDLYCGGGGIALFLAGAAGRVLGLEQNGSAIADAEANARLNGIENCRFVRADLSGQEPIPTRLPEGFETPAVAVVDPPREGLDAGLVQWLVKKPLPRLVYVSCNPATLARDAGLLSSAYELSAVQAVDLFPHTAHAECLALFTPLAQ